MISTPINMTQTGRVRSLLLGLVALVAVVWLLGSAISTDAKRGVFLLVAVIVVVAVSSKTVSDWRTGVYLFLVWLLFEDLIRKYMGNNMLIYFGKDALVGVTYIAFVMARLRGDVRKSFSPPFKYVLGMFVMLGLAQVFNANSPSVWYGLLGLKLYFYYIPLMFVGYALVRNERDLQNFFFVNAGLAAVISVVGICQSVFGLDFLNPHSGQDIEYLGHLVRVTPSGLLVPRPPSVFVSDGRFAWYLIVAMPLALGAAGYLLLRSRRGRKLVFPALGLVAVAATVSGSRGGFIWVAASSVVVPVGMLWGAPAKVGEGYRLVKAIRRSFIFVTFAVVAMATLFPQVVGSHWAFYRETMSPDSADNELVERAWAYPVRSFEWVFWDPDWISGHGIGTASLGVQYVSRIMGAPPTNLFSESGIGFLTIELGILGPILWLLWAGGLVFAGCKLLLRLKGTWGFPPALAIVWYAFVLLFPLTWGGIDPYENFVNNAYLWLLVGILFRLPGLVAESKLAEQEAHANELVLVPASTADRRRLALSR